MRTAVTGRRERRRGIRSACVRSGTREGVLYILGREPGTGLRRTTSTDFGQGCICVSFLNSQNGSQSISFVTVLFHYLTRRTLGNTVERTGSIYPDAALRLGLRVRADHRVAGSAGRIRRIGELMGGTHAEHG